MTIAQVSQKYGVSADTLRYYERIGLLPPVGRTKSGIRDYTEEDCNWVNFIKCMRSAGLPVETLIEYVGLFGQGDETIPARKELLMEQRRQLAARIGGDGRMQRIGRAKKVKRTHQKRESGRFRFPFLSLLHRFRLRSAFSRWLS